jgi:Lrp/AsnC family leucine-responsive transcriptional regulator
MSPSKTPPLDDIDRRLLNALQEDCSRRIAVVADLIGLSPSACYRRIQKLRDNKMILSEVALVDQRRSPWPLTVFVEVTMERLNEPVRATFEARALRLPQVMQCYAVSGDADFFLVLAVASTDDYHQFAREYLVSDETIKAFKSTFTIYGMKSKTKFEF